MRTRLLVIILFCACFILSLDCQSQTNAKQMAHSTPTSVNVNGMFLKNALPSSTLYDTWDNASCVVRTESVPSNFKIDLREFSMPIEHTMITSNFGKRWGRNHNGVDIKAYLGDTIRAAFDGKVRVVKYDKNGYGKVIVIRHYNGLETIYGHLSKQIVKVNDEVKVGQAIGLAGNTGRSTGTHLHFETRFCGVAINPLEIFSFKNKDVMADSYIWKK